MTLVAHSTLVVLLLATCAPSVAASRLHPHSWETALDADAELEPVGLLQEAAAHELAIAATAGTEASMEALVASLLQREDEGTGDVEALQKNCQWPSDLHHYTDQRKVGEGATACVFLAKAKDGTTVAVKLSKSGGKLSKWKSECGNMQSLHLAACKAGNDALNLMETYVPTCLEVGGSNDDPHYVMHAAGTQRIGKAAKSRLSKNELKSVFAQLVAAIYALHSTSWSHNDLHGGNAVLDGARLALIDFGSLRTLSKAKLTGSKRDGNRLWEHAASLAKCGKDTEWDRHGNKSELQKRAEKLKACISQSWGVDEAFLQAFDGVLKADIDGDADQHVKELFMTNFVQNNLPAMDHHFHWLQQGTCKPTKGSLAWD